MTDVVQPDVALGAYVYCKSHVGPHSTGWCGVGLDNKMPLDADSPEAAFQECKRLGLPVHNHCPICYRFIGNEPWYRNYERKSCPEHEEADQR